MNIISYDQIVEAVQFYASTKKYDEICAIIRLLERQGFPQSVIEHLLGDVHYVFGYLKKAMDSYSFAASLYSKNGEIIEAKSLENTIKMMF